MGSNKMARCAVNAAASAALLCILTTTAGAKASSEDATTFQVNAAHDGNVSFAAGFSAPLVQAWTYDTGGITSYPLIAHGTVYVVSSGNDVFALNLAAGSKLWEHLLGGNENLGAYDNGMLFYNSGDQLIALKAKNGRQIWSAGGFAPKGRIADNSTAPIAANQTVYVGGFGVTAFDEKAGTFKWQQGVDATSSQVAYGDSGIFAGGPSQYFKFSAADGSLLWHNSGCCSGGGGIAVTYFSKHVYLVDWAEGNFTLSSKTGNATGSFPGQTPPTFFTSGKRKFELVITNGKLYCQDAKTGNVAWSFANNNLTGQPLVINGQPVVAAGSSLYMLDGTTGAQLWTADAGGQISNMNAGDGALAVTTGNNVMVFVPQ